MRIGQVEVTIWRAADDERIAEVTHVLEAAKLRVRQLDAIDTAPQILLLLAGEGTEDLEARCCELAELFPLSPAVVLHTNASEQADPALEAFVFESLPASLELERLPKQILAALARWSRIEELKTSAVTLQQLESTTDLVYFDFRPATGTFTPSKQLSLLIGPNDSADAISPSPLLDRIHSDDRALFAGTLFEAARTGTPFCVQIRITDTSGRLRHFRTRGRAFGKVENGSAARVFGVCEDTTEHIKRLAEAEARSRVDDLTGLGNRRHFDDCLAAAIGRADREKEQLALLYIDLDRFKLINDTLGHDAGDQLLRVISARLSDAVRAHDVVCLDQDSNSPEARVSRLGGDEFTVLLSGIHGPSDADLVAKRMLEAISESVEIAGQMLTPSASVGIAIFPDDGLTTDNLRKRADAALYSAKGAGGGFRFFTQSMEDGAIRRLSLENELRQAIDKDELEMHYQPRIDFRANKIVGGEALLRWTSPTLGRVSPDEVFRIADDAGMSPLLGRWTLRQAFAEAAFWAESAERPCRLSINISPTQFEQDDVFSAVVEALKEAGLRPDLVDLEITESLLLREDSDISRALDELRRIGVRIVLDDFGKGYSALAVLMSQPIDVLKLDRLLVETVAPDGEGSQLLANVIRMAHDLSLHPIAEGVSHADQAEFLLSHGCHEMQGFHFAAALPVKTFRKKIGIH